MLGFLTVEYKEDVELLTHSLFIVKNSFENYNNSVLRSKPATDCNENGLVWKTGRLFLELKNFNYIYSLFIYN